MKNEPLIGYSIEQIIFIEILVTLRRKFSFRSIEGRMKFSIRNFAAKYNLGQPVAGNFLMAQYDDYVPKLHAQIGV